MGPGGFDGPMRQIKAVRQFFYAGFSWQVGDIIHVPLNVARSMIEAGNGIANAGWSTVGPIQEAWGLTEFQQPAQP
jgi:hypothetical protein